MNDNATYGTIAKAVRVERDTETDAVYIVFEVIDPQFKHTIQTEWNSDLPLKLIGKNLVKK